MHFNRNIYHFNRTPIEHSELLNIFKHILNLSFLSKANTFFQFGKIQKPGSLQELMLMSCSCKIYEPQ